VLLLAAVALALAARQPEPTYQAEDTPAAVAHNYLLALQQQDFARAYSYLSPELSDYPPDLETFTRQVKTRTWDFRLSSEFSLRVLSTEHRSDLAYVTVRRSTFSPGTLFENSQSSSTFDLTLRQVAPGGAWKLIDGNSYWNACWDRGGCK
jgi:hypothetical protein